MPVTFRPNKVRFKNWTFFILVKWKVFDKNGFNSGIFKIHLDDWIKGMVNDWAKDCECNVCAVDWAEMADHLLKYEDVATNHTRLAANSVARFIRFLKKKGPEIKFKEMSIAGHR